MVKNGKGPIEFWGRLGTFCTLDRVKLALKSLGCLQIRKRARILRGAYFVNCRRFKIPRKQRVSTALTLAPEDKKLLLQWFFKIRPSFPQEKKKPTTFTPKFDFPKNGSSLCLFTLGH